MLTGGSERALEELLRFGKRGSRMSNASRGSSTLPVPSLSKLAMVLTTEKDVLMLQTQSRVSRWRLCTHQ